MFTRNKIRLPELTGDWKRDGPEFKRALALYYESLEAPDALAIAEYESWTPVLTFATPGDLSVTYSSRDGWYVKVGKFVFVSFFITTSAFTHTTAAGNVQITGLPFGSDSAFTIGAGGGQFGGITKAGYTQVSSQINSSRVITLVASGSDVAASNVAAADMPTGGTVRLFFAFAMRVG